MHKYQSKYTEQKNADQKKKRERELYDSNYEKF